MYTYVAYMHHIGSFRMGMHYIIIPGIAVCPYNEYILVINPIVVMLSVAHNETNRVDR